MNINEKIKEVINTLTAEEIDSVIQSDLKKLSNDQITEYIRRAQDLGRDYFIDMVVNVGGQTSPEYQRRFGQFSKFLIRNKTTREWEVMSGAGLIPSYFAEPPKMVTKEVFISKAHEINIPADVLKEFAELDAGITS